MKNIGKKINILFVGFLLLGLYLVHGPIQVAFGAGFDCAKASTDMEKYICKYQEISDLDSILTKVYTERLSQLSGSERTKLVQEQRTWLEERDYCMGHVPDPRWFCVVDSYRSRIVALGGIEQLIEYYGKLCADDEWQCIPAGDFALKNGNQDAALEYYGVMCDADRDGDHGDTCYKKAVLLEQQGRVDEARALYIKTCEFRHHNEACYAAQRLTVGIDENDSWAGLYKNHLGTMLVTKIADSEYRLVIDAYLDHRNSCNFSGSFTVVEGMAEVRPKEANLECKPTLKKSEDDLIFDDIENGCRSMCKTRVFYKSSGF